MPVHGVQLANPPARVPQQGAAQGLHASQSGAVSYVIRRLCSEGHATDDQGWQQEALRRGTQVADRGWGGRHT